MVVGFNHNFRYKGEVYHIQTEDSGVKSPNIVTLLYQGGTILGSKKTSYADIAKVDNLEQVVEELMKEQHKDMLRSLKAGEYDEIIDRFQSGKKVSSKEEKVTASKVDSVPVAKPSPPVPPAAEAKPALVAPQAEAPAAAETAKPAPLALQEEQASPTIETSLDEVILSYLMGDD